MLQRLSEEDAISLAKLEQDEQNKENQPPNQQAESKGHVDGHVTSEKQLGSRTNVQTLGISQFGPRQSLSIRIPKAKMDRWTQASCASFLLLRFHLKRETA